MTDDDSQHRDELPSPEIRHARRWSVSLVWLVPAVAVVIGIVLIVRAALSAGTMVAITFKSADGLEAGVTEVRYKDVVVGVVRSIGLTEDLQRVVVSVELSRNAQRLAVDDTRFWVVRPRVDTGGISGLGTLVSGAYISMDVGSSSEERTEFEGLETPPAVTSDQKGRSYVLHTDDLGSLDIGSPVYFRRIPVGRVGGYTLNEDGQGVTLTVFVEEPYDRYVTPTSRFWNASGFDVSLTATGLEINTQSLATVLAGGVAFDSGDDGEPAPDNSQYWLYANRAESVALPTDDPLEIRMRFSESLRGLSIDAPIDFRGVEIGSVQAMDLEYDAGQKRFYGSVVGVIYPSRLGPAYEALSAEAGHSEDIVRRIFIGLVHDGLRAQLRTGNLITGQLYVALDFIPKAKAAEATVSNGGLEIPTERGSLSQIQTQIADIVTKLNQVPFDDMGRNLRDALASADALLKRLDDDLAPEAKATLAEAQRTLQALSRTLAQDSDLQLDLRSTLSEVERAGRSLRALADYLQRHPESLLRGKPQAEAPQDDGARDDRE